MRSGDLDSFLSHGLDRSPDSEASSPIGVCSCQMASPDQRTVELQICRAKLRKVRIDEKQLDECKCLGNVNISSFFCQKIRNRRGGFIGGLPEKSSAVSLSV